MSQVHARFDHFDADLTAEELYVSDEQFPPVDYRDDDEPFNLDEPNYPAFADWTSFDTSVGDEWPF